MLSFFLRIVVVLVGLAAGSLVNFLVLSLGNAVIALPEGADMSTPEEIARSMPMLMPVHFITPFAAHAIGTLAGAWLTARLAKNHALWSAMVVGVLFLAGGAYMVAIVPSPVWFTACDLVLAYIPMALLGWSLSGKKRELIYQEENL
jgi:hypothetical protein